MNVQQMPKSRRQWKPTKSKWAYEWDRHNIVETRDHKFFHANAKGRFVAPVVDEAWLAGLAELSRLVEAAEEIAAWKRAFPRAVSGG